MEQQSDKEEEDIDGYEGAIVFDPKELVYNYLPGIIIPIQKRLPAIVDQKKYILMLDIVLDSNIIIDL